MTPVKQYTPISRPRTCLLRVVRRSSYADKFRKYKIFVNDEQVGTIGTNNTVEFQVPDGHLKVAAQVDWGQSKSLFIDAAPNQKIEVEVSHTRSFLAFYSATFGYGSYLTLKQVHRDVPRRRSRGRSA